MNIAILHCKEAANVCTGAACFKAFNNRTHSFAEYPEKPELCAFFHCGGCDVNQKNDSDMIKKMERLRREGVKRVHVGKCIGMECKSQGEIIAMLEQYGLEVVYGTH